MREIKYNMLDLSYLIIENGVEIMKKTNATKMKLVNELWNERNKKKYRVTIQVEELPFTHTP